MPENPPAAPGLAPATAESIPGVIKDGFTDQVTKVMKEYGDKLMADFKAQFSQDLQKMVDAAKAEALQAVKAGLGLSNDPTLRLSEVGPMVQKILRESGALPGQRSENPIKDQPAAGLDLTKGTPAAADPEQRFAAIAKGGNP